jgi:hypothetical protein
LPREPWFESAGVNHMILCITDPAIVKAFTQKDVSVPSVTRSASAHPRRGRARVRVGAV